MRIDDRTEWLEADGLGGFVSGTTSGIRTRRYHALLLPATTPPTGRVVLVNGFDAWAETAAGTFALTTQRYAPDVLHPDGATRISAFTSEPWPTWTIDLPDGTRIRQEVFARHGAGETFVLWRLERGAHVTLRVRPLLSGRDYHSTHHENTAFRFDVNRAGAAVTCFPYDGIPGTMMLSNGTYRHAPDWYRQFLYTAEQERGLDAIEDLAAPGEFSWPLGDAGDEAALVFRAVPFGVIEEASVADVVTLVARVRSDEERRRNALGTGLQRAADAYLVKRGQGRTLVAGYPWFTDWGRDTFIAVRGLCLATGRLAEARDVLVAWAGAVSEGMLPNRFPDTGELPEFNSVDASLWYVVAVHELLQHDRRQPGTVSAADRDGLRAAVSAIVAGYARGTRFGIHMDADGLLAAGVPGVQLTWMDARVGDEVVTPRIGKPVEVQALWLNALAGAAEDDSRWNEVFERGREAFAARFWDEARGHLADVVDVDHVPGVSDSTLRPNQILAVGGLPIRIVTGERARRIVDAVEGALIAPMGLRSLSPADPRYRSRYEGDSRSRDGAYHQGTIWPWLMGPFVDAWLSVHNGRAARAEARRRFVDPLLAHLREAGLHHVSEIADADEPFTPRGCPFQAWSLGELIRADALASANPEPRKPTRARRSARLTQAVL